VIKTLFFIFFLSSYGFSFAQSEDINILWSEEYQLKWEDFKGAPPEETLFHANTNAGMSYSWEFKSSSEDIELVYKIDNIFYPNLSWVHSTSKNDILLKHEQLHFDISELHARKLRKTLSNLDLSKLNNGFKSYSKMIYEQVVKENREMQIAFDRESNHSLNIEAELRWQQFIQDELNKFAQYIN
tara:strand:+ start:4030 stop:4584 length:555 start_codon:yes stop_codon:yes gene_type:complete